MKPQEQRPVSSATAQKAAKTAVANRVGSSRAKRRKPTVRAIAERYHALALAAGHIIWTTDSTGTAIDAADWYAYTGQSPTAAAGIGWLETIHPDDRARVHGVWQEAHLNHQTYELEYRLRRADGVYRTFLVRGVPVFEPDGELREWTGFCTDITARKTAEEERDLARAEGARRAGELEAIFEAIGDGIIVVDDAGTILHANRAYCSLLALEPTTDLTALPFVERRRLLNSRDEHGHAMRPERLPVMRVLRGELLSGANTVDLTIKRMDGRDITVNVSGAAITGADGGVRGGVIVFRDVTSRRQLEQQPRATLTALVKMAEALVSDETPFEQSGYHALHDKAAQRLAELTRNVIGCQSVGIATFNSDAATFTPAAIIATTPAEEHFWWQTMQRANFDKHFTAAQEARLLVGESITFTVAKHIATRATTTRDVLLAPIHYDEHLIGLVGLEHADCAHVYSEDEITLVKAVTRLAAITIERKRLVREREEALARELASQEAQQRMDEFLSVISHELRAPLTLIKGNVQLAERRLQRIDIAEMEALDVAERVRLVCDLLQRADRQIGLENRLVSDLLDASRMHADHLDLLMQPCDLVALANEIVEEVRQVYASRQIRLATPPVRSLMVEADAERIGQVIMNYLTNALKYSPAAQPIDVDLAVLHDELRLSVHDRGSGLPVAEHERVWERFHRAPHTPQSGLGLGLYICRTIIAQHHGQVGLTSAPGQGATFWFTLPLAPIVADG